MGTTIAKVRVQPKKIRRNRTGRAWVADVTLHMDGGGAVHVGNVRCYMPPQGGPLQITMPSRQENDGSYTPVVALPGPWLDELRAVLEEMIREQVIAEAAK